MPQWRGNRSELSVHVSSGCEGQPTRQHMEVALIHRLLRGYKLCQDRQRRSDRHRCCRVLQQLLLSLLRQLPLTEVECSLNPPGHVHSPFAVGLQERMVLPSGSTTMIKD